MQPDSGHTAAKIHPAPSTGSASQEPEAADVTERAVVTSAAVERKMETLRAHRLPPTSFFSQFPGPSF